MTENPGSSEPTPSGQPPEAPSAPAEPPAQQTGGPDPWSFLQDPPSAPPDQPHPGHPHAGPSHPAQPDPARQQTEALPQSPGPSWSIPGGGPGTGPDTPPPPYGSAPAYGTPDPATPSPYGTPPAYGTPEPASPPPPPYGSVPAYGTPEPATPPPYGTPPGYGTPGYGTPGYPPPPGYDPAQSYPPPMPYGSTWLPTRSPESSSVRTQAIIAMVINIATVLFCCTPLGIAGAITAGIAIGRADTDVRSARRLVAWGWGLLAATVALAVIGIVLLFALGWSLDHGGSTGGAPDYSGTQ